MGDTTDGLVERLRSRAAAAPRGEPRQQVLVADLDGLAHALGRLLPAAGAVDVSGYRLEGRVYPDGSGHIIEAFPYGGSVIDGYDHRLTAVLADGAVVIAEQPDLRPSCAVTHGDAPDVHAAIAHAEQDARVRVEAPPHTVWPRLRYAVLDRVRERFGWPALAAKEHETLAIALDGTSVRFTYTSPRDGEAWSGAATLDEHRELSAAVWEATSTARSRRGPGPARPRRARP